MQWFRQNKSEDPSDFWKEVEARRGGAIGFLSFATLLGRSNGTRVDLPGLLYTVNETAWFEDFEKDNWLYRIMAGSRTFEKTEMSFGLAEVSGIRFITRRWASRCMDGSVRPGAAPRASAFAQFFSVPIVEVALHDGSAIYFDLLKRKEFAALFERKDR